jgi:hypothetical protein
MPEIKIDINDPGRVEVTPADDDQSSRYLLSRQVAHEYHAPAVQALVQADKAEQQVRQQAALTEVDQFKKDQAKKKAEETGRVEDFTAGIVSDLATRKPESTTSKGTKGEKVALEGGGGGWGDNAPDAMPSVAADVKAEVGGIEAPMVDPVMAASSGGASAAFLTYAKLGKFVPSLAAAVRAGVVNAAMEPVYGTAAEVVGANNPALAVPFNILAGLGGGMVLEPMLERAITRASAKIGKAIDLPMMRSVLANEVGAVGEIDDLTKRAVIEELNTEIKSVPANKLGIPAPPEGDTAVTGPNRPGMVKAAQEFLANTNPDITTEMAGKSNIRLWSGGADLTPKWMDEVNSPEDLMRITTAMADTFPEQIQAARRGTRSHAVTEAAAEGMTLEMALGRKGAQALNAEQTVNLQNHTVASISALQEMKTIMNSGNATPLNELDFMKTFNMSYALINQYAGNAAEVGRALEIHKRIKQATGMKIGELKDFMTSLTGLPPDQIAARMADMTNIGQMKQFILQGHRATTINMWNEAYINGMLWLPTTHMANTVSNALTDVMSVGERYVAAAISKSPIGSGEISFREAQAYAYGMAQATGDAWCTFAKTVRTGEPSDVMTKLDLSGQGRKAITGENVASEIDKVKQRFGKEETLMNPVSGGIHTKIPPFEFDQASPLKRFIDVAGEITRTPGRFLLAEDDAFKTIAYRGELHALSYRKAMAEFENNVPDAEKYLAKIGIATTGMDEEKIVKTAMANRIAEIIDDPGKHASEVQIGAKDQARYLTYTSPIDNKIVNAIRTSQNPFLKMLIPFTGTPYNIFRYTTERTPLFGGMLKSMREDFMAGGARRDLTLAKQAIGTMVWGSAVAMVMASGEDSPVKIYGYGPREPNRRKAWLRDGHKPYSFEFGNTTVEYGRMEPFASIFGIAVDGSEILGIADPKLAPETDKIFPAFMAATAQGYMSKTFLQGIANGVQAFYEADVNKMQKAINSYGKSAVPFSSAIRGVEQAISPQRKAVDGLFEAIQSEIPYFSDKLPVQVDLWNRPLSKEMEKNESSLQTAVRVVSPIYISKRQDSPIDKELWKNFKEGLPMPQREQHFKGEGLKSIPYELNNRQYADFIKYMNEEPLQSTDMKLKQSLDYMVKHDENYKNETDPAEKMKMIRGKINEAVTMARKKMYETDALIRNVVDIRQEELANQ